MGEMRQSPVERAQLKAAWEARPAVAEFAEAAEAFAWKQGLKFDVAGMNAMLAFGNDWIAAHGPLPDTGILVG